MDKSDLVMDILPDYFTQACKGSLQMLLFETEYTVLFCDMVDTYHKKITSNHAFYTFSAGHASSIEPYSPCFKIISDYIKQENSTIEELMEESGVYPLQRSVFSSYFNKSFSDDYEEIILGELAYEKLRFNESIIKLLATVSSDKPLIIAISDIHICTPNILEFIRSTGTDKNVSNAKILFLYSYNKNHYYENDIDSDRWAQFIHDRASHSTIFKLNKQETYLEYEWIPVDQFRYSDNDISRALAHTFFLNHHEAIEYALVLYEQYTGNQLDYSESDLFQLFIILGDCYYYLNDNEHALLYYQLLLDNALVSKTKSVIIKAYYKLSLVYIQKYDLESAQRLCFQCIKHAEKNDNQLQIIKSYFLNFLIADIQVVKIPRKQYLYLLEKSKQQGLSRMYGYICKNSYIYHAYYNGFDEVEDLCNEAIQISQQCGNDFSLAVDYHKKGIIYSYRGDFETALIWFQKSEALRGKLGDPLEIIRITNGIGYYYLLLENYFLAHQYFNKAATKLYPIRNYNEICVTLYNLTLVYSLNREFDTCLAIIDIILQIMNVLKMTFIPFRSLQDIYIHKAFCYYKLGYKLKAYEYCDRIDITNNTVGLEYKLIYYILSGNFALKHNDIDKIAHNFKESEKLFDTSIQSFQMYFPFYYYEFGIIYKKLGDNDTASKYFTLGLKYCKKLGYSLYIDLLKSQMNKCEMIDKKLIQLPKINVNLEALFEIASINTIVNKLQKKIKIEKFLNEMQTLLKLNIPVKDLSIKFLNLLYSYFPIEQGFFHMLIDNKWVEISSLPDTGQTDETVLLVIEQLQKKDRQLLLNVNNVKNEFPQLVDLFNSIINIALVENDTVIGNIFLATVSMENYFTISDVNMVNVAVNQFANILERIESNKNKKELYDRIQEMNEKLLNLNNKMVETNYKLIKQNEFKSKYLADMSHEIRTPLNVILGNNQNMLFGAFDINHDFNEINSQIMNLMECAEDELPDQLIGEIVQLCADFNNFVFLKGETSDNYYVQSMRRIIDMYGNKKNSVILQLQQYCVELESIINEEKLLEAKSLESSSRGCNYLLSLIDSILDISKIEAGKIVIESGTVDLNDFINDLFFNALSYCKAKGKMDNINIITVIDSNLPEEASFDKARMKQVMLNLISNAIKFTRQGEINISVTYFDYDTEIISSDIEKQGTDEVVNDFQGELVFSVKDSGIGIKQKDIEKLFLEFSRISKTKEIEGTGLGLALSKKLVELHGGTIEVVSEFGKGSEFIVRIPLKTR